MVTELGVVEFDWFQAIRSLKMKLKIKPSEIPPLAEIKLRQLGYTNLSVSLVSVRPLKLAVHSEVGPAIFPQPVPIDAVVRDITSSFEIVD
jgi:hypothetical protein